MPQEALEVSLSDLGPGVRGKLGSVFSKHLIIVLCECNAEGAVFNNAAMIWQKLFNLEEVIFTKQSQISVIETIAHLPSAVI